MRAHVSIAALLLCFALAAPAAPPELTDAEITTAIDAHLMRRLTTEAFHAIDVTTSNGTVTLNGQVRDLLTKRRAVEIAGAIRGVRGVVDLVRVEPVVRTDDAIRADVVAGLRVEPVTGESALAVEVSGGTVTLRGTVQSAQERIVAGRVAAAVPGVRALRNDLAIQYATTRSDAEIEADVRGRLRWDARIDARNVQVSVRNGTVVLSGHVGSVSERVLAVNDAWVNGVRIVTDRLRVVPTPAAAQRRSAAAAPSDVDIRGAIVQAFALDPRVVSFNPVVTVRNGVVTLTGTVNDLQARNAAEADARNVNGVRFVNNYLKVRPTVARSDLAIAGDVGDALRRNAAVDAAEVMVSVRSGVVTLSGTVDSRFERQEALDATARVAGVVGVINNLVLPAAWPVKSDRAIERDAEAGILWNAFVDGSDVDVTVRNGVATVTGTVGSFADVLEAESEVFEAGATRVINQLFVDAVPDVRSAALPSVGGRWSGMLAEMLMALIAAALLTAGLYWLVRRRGLDVALAAMVAFFVIVFLATWAVGSWISPRGPTAFGVPWLAFLIIACVIALVAAAAPPVRHWRVAAAAGTPEPRVAGPLIWILLAMLVLAIIGNQVEERRASAPPGEQLGDASLSTLAEERTG